MIKAMYRILSHVRHQKEALILLQVLYVTLLELCNWPFYSNAFFADFVALSSQNGIKSEAGYKP